MEYYHFPYETAESEESEIGFQSQDSDIHQFEMYVENALGVKFKKKTKEFVPDEVNPDIDIMEVTKSMI